MLFLKVSKSAVIPTMRDHKEMGSVNVWMKTNDKETIFEQVYRLLGYEPKGLLTKTGVNFEK